MIVRVYKLELQVQKLVKRLIYHVWGSSVFDIWVQEGGNFGGFGWATIVVVRVLKLELQRLYYMFLNF